MRTVVMGKLLVPALLLVFAGPLMAADPDGQAVSRAHDLLKTAQSGRDVMSYVHFGSPYNRHDYVKTLNVTDPRGNLKPGEFALVYDYVWDKTGKTRLAFLCDRRGYIYEVQILEDNGIFSQPYDFANAAVQVLGNLIVQALGDNLTEKERKELKAMIDNADAHRMLEWSLAVQQRLRP